MPRWIKITGRTRRRKIIRKKVVGTKERPRLSVYRSLNHMYAQLINDVDETTVMTLSTNMPDIKNIVKNNAGNIKGAVALGEALAKACVAKGVTKAVFDRSGYLYHGRVKALADAARKAGLAF